MRDAKIVAFGGGTGLSVLLRGLKEYTENITAVVTVADNGGSSGRLRKDLGILPPGDIRNCIIALSDTEPMMEKLMQYRFPEGELKGHNFGNLYLAAMTDLSGGFLEAIENTSDVLAVTGKVLPVTLDDVHLVAELENGDTINGERYIGKSQKLYGHNISRVWLDRDCEPLQEVIVDILAADILLFGPGSLYTSIIPNLLVPGIINTIGESSAKKIYISNMMTQPGETEGYNLNDHITALEAHTYEGIIDYVITNNNYDIEEELLKRYKDDYSTPVIQDDEIFGTEIVADDLITVFDDKIRHDFIKLSNIIRTIFRG